MRTQGWDGFDEKGTADAGSRIGNLRKKKHLKMDGIHT